MGLRVPEDVSVVGYDDIQLSSFFNPPLTTVSQPKKAMGRAAFALLRERIADERMPTRSVTMSARLVVRRSTAAAAAFGRGC
jgi:DNA-binding LacI/PurR family transcriptional regulator